MSVHPTTVRRLTSGARGEPRWEATVKGKEHEVVWKGTERDGYLWCVTCGRQCAGVRAVMPHVKTP